MPIDHGGDRNYKCSSMDVASFDLLKQEVGGRDDTIHSQGYRKRGNFNLSFAKTPAAQKLGTSDPPLTPVVQSASISGTALSC
jgi:hypothetical protein